jgi:hypothetical protein
MTKKPWRYRLSRPEAVFSLAIPTHIEFQNEWLSIQGGVIRVSAGYAWDGCSPAIPVPGTRLWLGVPDGPLGIDGRPVSWRASLLHDALCQFRKEISGLTKEVATAVFYERMLADDAPWWMRELYTAGVDLLGPQDFVGDGAVPA